MSAKIITMFALYFALILFIGFYFFRKNKNAEDYFLGGRSMGPVVSALSAGASDMSSWLLMGLPGALYVSGLTSSYIAIGLTLGAFLNWSFVAKRLRIFTGIIRRSITIPDYLETRFDDKTHILRVVCAALILLFFTIYVSSGLVGGAKLFETAFGVDYTLSLVIGTLVIVIYTFLGGYKAVCWTDLIQGILMMSALIVVPVFMIKFLGGVGVSVDLIKSANPEAFLMTGNLSAAISAMAWGLGYFGQPHILVRFMSIRSTKDIGVATVVGISWMAVSLIGACLVGLLGIAYMKSLGTSLDDPEKIFIFATQTLFNPWVAGILLSAILAAIMSTASSQLLVSSSTIAEDFYKRIFHKNAPANVVLIIARISVLAVALVAFLISTDKNSSVLSIVAYAWAGFGASFGSVILLSLFWRKMTRGAAIGGMVSGAVTVVLHKHYLKQFWDIYEIVPGFLVALFVIVVISIFSKPQNSVTAIYDNMTAKLNH